jgi:hypothetical protein
MAAMLLQVPPVVSNGIAPNAGIGHVKTAQRHLNSVAAGFAPIALTKQVQRAPTAPNVTPGNWTGS